MSWACFTPPQAWYDDRYVELRFEKYTPSADLLIGKTLREEDIKTYNLPVSYIGKIVESVSYPSL